MTHLAVLLSVARYEGRCWNDGQSCRLLTYLGEPAD